jgi:adenosylhomocysteine nucleosidase
VTTLVRKLGIMTAMEEEFRLIRTSFGFASPQEVGPRTFLSARYEEVDLVLVPARPGKVAAAVSTSILIHEFKVDSILFTGVAGGAHPDVRVGDIVVADHLVQHDINLKGVLGCQRFEIPLVGASELPCCPHLVTAAVSAAERTVASNEYQHALKDFCATAPRIHRGTIASGDTFICEADERDDLTASIRELRCVEMEGAAVAQVCVEHRVPFVVGRIISDDACAEAPVDFNAFITSAAAVGSGAFVRHFVSELCG